MTKKTQNPQKQEVNRNSEIRVRYVEPEIFKALEAIAAHYKIKTTPDLIRKLITAWKGDQDLIKALSKRNSELHAGIAKYVNRESAQREAVKQQIRNLVTATKESEKILKQFQSKK